MRLTMTNHILGKPIGLLREIGESDLSPTLREHRGWGGGRHQNNRLNVTRWAQHGPGFQQVLAERKSFLTGSSESLLAVVTSMWSSEG